MALPSPVAVDDTVGGTTILAAHGQGYRSIFIKNLDSTNAVDYTFTGEAPVYGSCLRLAAGAELHLTEALEGGLGLRPIKAIADTAVTVNVYVEAQRK